MERLTIEYCGGYVPKEMCSIDKLGGADDCDLCCEYCKATEDGNEDCRGCAINQCFNKLGEYETLEEQGKLPRLPCAVGDTVYYADNEYYFAVLPVKVDEIAIMESNAILYKCLLFDGNGDVETQFDFDKDDFGKTVFLTPEKAKAALMKGEGEMDYGKKPVMIEAFELKENFMKIGVNCEGIPDWGISAYDDGDIYFDINNECFIKTLEGEHHASVGDFIIRGVNGEIYPCKPDVFKKTYDEAGLFLFRKRYL